jgi:SAM-dependent methyltransferase
MVERYIIRGGVAGADRLRVLARQWAPSTSALLDRVGVPVGARCLDLGCGAGDVTLELAHRVGTRGHVTAVDMDAVKLEVTRDRADAGGFANIDAVVSDVYAYRPSESFDLVYCRNLLQHLSRPVQLLRNMWRAVRVGGALVVEDADFEGSFCYPPNDGFEFWLTRYQRVLRSYGGDPLSGRKLPARFADAGIPPPQIAVVQRVDLTGEAKTMPMLTVDATAAAMSEAGIATAEEIEAALDQLRVFAADDSTLHGSPRLFQAWSRRTP